MTEYTVVLGNIGDDHETYTWFIQGENPNEAVIKSLQAIFITETFMTI